MTQSSSPLVFSLEADDDEDEEDEEEEDEDEEDEEEEDEDEEDDDDTSSSARDSDIASPSSLDSCSVVSSLLSAGDSASSSDDPYPPISVCKYFFKRNFPCLEPI